MEELLLISTALMLALALFLLLFVFQYRNRLNSKKRELDALIRNQEVQLLNSMMEAQEKERDRIAHELHDNLGAMLSTIKIYFKSIEESHETLKDEIQQRYDKANYLLDETVSEVRKISHNLSSSSVRNFGLIPSIKKLIKPIEESGLLKVDFMSFDLEGREVGFSIQMALYRIIGELVNNVLRHSEATELTIQLIERDENMHLTVEDNGVGFDKEQEVDGIGLRAVEARVYLLGGIFSVDSKVGHGSTIIVDIPLKKNDQND